MHDQCGKGGDLTHSTRSTKSTESTETDGLLPRFFTEGDPHPSQTLDGKWHYIDQAFEIDTGKKLGVDQQRASLSPQHLAVPPRKVRVHSGPVHLNVGKQHTKSGNVLEGVALVERDCIWHSPQLQAGSHRTYRVQGRAAKA